LHLDGLVAVGPANCDSHPVGLVLVDPAQAGWHRADWAAGGLVPVDCRPDGSRADQEKNRWKGSGARHCAQHYGRPGAPEVWQLPPVAVVVNLPVDCPGGWVGWPHSPCSVGPAFPEVPSSQEDAPRQLLAGAFALLVEPTVDQGAVQALAAASRTEPALEPVLPSLLPCVSQRLRVEP